MSRPRPEPHYSVAAASLHGCREAPSKLDSPGESSTLQGVERTEICRPTEHDAGIRAELLRMLSAEFASDPSTVVLDEFGILEGRNRVDVAVINGALHAFEIKSDRDTLARLDRQAHAYARVFDYVTVVATDRHIAALATLLPGWWGLSEARHVHAHVVIRRVRRPKRNPGVEPNALVQLLWRDEALRILVELGAARGLSGKPRRVVWQRLVETLDSIELLSLYVRETIKTRPEWRDHSAPMATPSQQTQGDD